MRRTLFYTLLLSALLSLTYIVLTQLGIIYDMAKDWCRALAAVQETRLAEAGDADHELHSEEFE